MRRLILTCLIYGGFIGSVLYIALTITATGIAPMAFLVGLLVALLTLLSARSNLKKVYRKPGQQLFFEDRMIMIDNQAIKVDMVNGMSTTYPWSIILKAEWGRDLLLLYVTDLSYVIIPRRVIDLKTEEAIRAAIAQARPPRGVIEPPAGI